MGKIDTLSNEIKKYTKSYNDILVGMHNDVTKYKNEVKSQAVKTNHALKVIEDDSTRREHLRVEVEYKFKKIEEYYQNISEAEKNIQSAIVKFEAEKQTMYDNLSSIKEDLSKKIDSNDKKLRNQIELLAENLSLTKEELTTLIHSNNTKLNNELNLTKKRINNKQNILLCFTVLLCVAMGYLYYKML